MYISYTEISTPPHSTSPPPHPCTGLFSSTNKRTLITASTQNSLLHLPLVFSFSSQSDSWNTFYAHSVGFFNFHFLFLSGTFSSPWHYKNVLWGKTTIAFVLPMVSFEPVIGSGSHLLRAFLSLSSVMLGIGTFHFSGHFFAFFFVLRFTSELRSVGVSQPSSGPFLSLISAEGSSFIIRLLQTSFMLIILKSI